ncbi:MAG TPA: hypothetical protein VHO69_10425 [Phototrophicaceae bacterium]|nr:hypothetical protein [Phototrophicaceae bacterium]
MLKRLLIIFGLLTVLMIAAVAYAQDEATPVEYGQLVEGELTSDATEINYTIKIDEGDVVVVEMRHAPDSDLYSLAAKVLSPDGRPIADATEDSNSDVSVVGFVAEESGEYTVVASRGSYSDSTGPFLLRVIKAEALEDGAEVEGNISNDSYDQYFTLPNAQDITLSYMQLDGDYSPSLDILWADEAGVLHLMATAGAIKDVTMSASFKTDDDALYIAAVTAQSIDYEYEDIDSNFQLALTAN